jgi:hypothetical protein
VLCVRYSRMVPKVLEDDGAQRVWEGKESKKKIFSKKKFTG